MQTRMMELSDDKLKVIRLRFDPFQDTGFKVGEFFTTSSSPNGSEIALFLNDSTILSMANALAEILVEIHNKHRNEQAVSK